MLSCPSCGSGVQYGATECWLCGYRPGGAALPAQYQAPPPPQSSMGWLVVVIGTIFVIVLLAVQFALIWPGLLIPLGLVSTPLGYVLFRIVQEQRVAFWRTDAPVQTYGQQGYSQARQFGPRGEPIAHGGRDGDKAAAVAGGLAAGLLAILAVVGVLMLVAIAGMAIFFVICITAMHGG